MKKPAKPAEAGHTTGHTTEQRIAITENQRIVALLTEAKTPHAKDLALVVLARIAAIGEGADVSPASQEDTRMMVAFALENTVTPEEAPTSGAAARAMKGKAN
jgi:hypothetical protein